MRKKFVIFGLPLVGFVVAVVWFYFGPVPGIGAGLSARDVLAIRHVVRNETAEPILRIRGDGTGAATVQTGRTGNGLDGSGHYYRLNQTAAGWQIVARETWISALPNQSVERMAAGERRLQSQTRWAAAIDHFFR